MIICPIIASCAVLVRQIHWMRSVKFFAFPTNENFRVLRFFDPMLQLRDLINLKQLGTLNWENWLTLQQRGALKRHPSFFLNISVTEFSITLRRIPRAINQSVMELHSDFRNSPTRYWITLPEVRWCGWCFGENVINLVTIGSKGVNQFWKKIQRCCVCFWGCRSYRCW